MLSELQLALSASDPAIAVALLDVFAWLGVGILKTWKVGTSSFQCMAWRGPRGGTWES